MVRLLECPQRALSCGYHPTRASLALSEIFDTHCSNAIRPMRSAALLCVLAASLDASAAYQLTSRGGSRRDMLKAFAATAPLFAAANSASAGTVGAAPVSDRFSNTGPCHLQSADPAFAPRLADAGGRGQVRRHFCAEARGEESNIRKDGLRGRGGRQEGGAPLPLPPTHHHRPLLARPWTRRTTRALRVWQLEYLLRTSLCGFQAKLKCKGSGKPPK